MSGLEIGLLIIGAVFFVGSFFVSEKLSSSDMDEIKGLSEDEMKALLEKNLKEADEKLDKALSEKIDEKTEEFAAGADKETNNRIMSIGEYADSVFDSMSKTHDEIVFLYQMLNDKQEQMTKLTKTLGEAESHVRELLTEAERQKEEAERIAKAPVRTAPVTIEKAPEPVVAHTDTSAFPPLPEVSDKPADEEEQSSEDSGAQETAVLSDLKAQAGEENSTPQQKEDSRQASDQADTKKIREKIISMYHQGYSLLDIAKETGKGIGEVQLILELFDEKDEEA
ncbi:MAG: DUF6115 domain-containing protein [Lachnospiraceae bacterium]|nr:DUF6115 domain-containing protein [Lachnospiraceae bacterium]